MTEKGGRGFQLGRWYTYRTAVGVLLGLVVAGAMTAVAVQDQACRLGEPGCIVSQGIHPEDNLFPTDDPPDPNVVVVGIGDDTISQLHEYPPSRDKYATLLDNLAKAGAAVVAFDVAFSEERTGDGALQAALVRDKLPVVLAYGQCDGCLNFEEGRLAMTGLDQIPLRRFRCLDASTDPNAPCTDPNPNVQLASTGLVTGTDGVMRAIPMFVEPRCRALGHCETGTLNPLSLVAYRDYFFGAGANATPLRRVAGGVELGGAWSRPLWVDDYGQAMIGWSGGPGNLAAHGQLIPFWKVYQDQVPAASLKGKIVIVGAYGLTGVADSQPVPTGGGATMAGVEIHANALTTLMSSRQSRFTSPEPVTWLVVTIFGLCLGMGALLARLSVFKGMLLALGAAAAYGAPWLLIGPNPVPDLFHPWLGIAATYTGLSAYRFLYEDREKRKVTAIFGQYLKPEIVAELAQARSLEDLERGGSRRELTFLFVDIRGFTSLSETISVEDVLKVVDAYLGALTDVIFKWDGTVDKYVGDEIMAFWNAPRDQPDHALRAVRCGEEMLSHGAQLQADLKAAGLPAIRYGVGVNTGSAIVGNIGSRHRRQYTALGDTVNTAARFCAAAGPFELLIGEATLAGCQELVRVTEKAGMSLKGKTAASFKVYRVDAVRADELSPWVLLPEASAESSKAKGTEPA